MVTVIDGVVLYVVVVMGGECYCSGGDSGGPIDCSGDERGGNGVWLGLVVIMVRVRVG